MEENLRDHSLFFKDEIMDCIKQLGRERYLFTEILKILQNGYWAEDVSKLNLYEKGNFAFYQNFRGGGLYRLDEKWSQESHELILLFSLSSQQRCENEISIILQKIARENLWSWKQKTNG